MPRGGQPIAKKRRAERRSVSGDPRRVTSGRPAFAAPRALVTALAAMAAAYASAAAGLDICAKRAQSETNVAALGTLAAEHRAIAADLDRVAESLGAERREPPRTCERLRWEWLASTASVLDGGPEGRLLAEIGRVTGGVVSAAAPALNDALASRVRAAEEAVAKLAATLPSA